MTENNRPNITDENLQGKMLWFDFVLNPDLLSEYLTGKEHNNDGKQSVVELVANFLSNAKTISDTAAAITTNGVIESTNPWATPPASPILGDQMDIVSQNGSTPLEETLASIVVPSLSEKKKFRALKLLALKATSFLNWDLRVLETKLPLHMQSLLLNELIKTLSSIPILEVKDNLWEEMSADVRFAHLTLHRWTIRVVINGSYPTRQAKGISVHVPGQNDPTWAPPEATEGILKTLKEQCHQSAISLEELMKILSRESREFKIRMPVPECFGILTEEKHIPNNKWDNGLEIKREDATCQLAYDLGCIYFFNQQYSLAYTMFKKSSHLFQSMEKVDLVVSTLDKQKLDGYVSACEQALSVQEKDLSSQSTASSTVAQLLCEMGKGSPEILTILLEDNLKRKMPKSVRDRMEMDFVRQFGSNHPLYPKIIIANALRHAVEGDVILTDLRPYLSSPQHQDFFCTALKTMTDKSTFVQKNLLQKFLQLLLTDYKDLTSRCAKCGIMEPLFGTRNPKCLKIVKEKRITRVPRDISFTQDALAVMGRKERELLSTRRVDSVTSLVKQFQKMSNGSGKLTTSAATLSKHWELPHFLEVLVRGQSSKDQETTYVLLAKAIELRNSKCYEDSRSLFRKIEADTKESLPKMYSTVQWELCHTDLLQFTNDPLSHTYEAENPKRQAAVKQAKSCLTTYLDGRESLLKNELVELAAMILLNCQEWSVLSELEVQRSNPSLELTRLLALLCRNIEAPKSNRSVVRELWDIFISLFNTSSGQYKRSGSGSVKESYRDSHNGQFTKALFQKFVRNLTGTLVLGLLISGVIRIYNMVKDESSQEISAEHQQLWPAILGSNVHCNISSVGQLLQDLLHHALRTHPTHQSWLNSQADLMYTQNHYAAALKFYISAGAACSNFFSQPLPRYLFHDQQVKRMIQCCTKLQCHTQAAVLTQFLEELNYSLSFKSLGERICCDSCNSHYAHIWDVTLLEYLVNMHARRGENDRRALAQQFLGLLELNANNNEEIQREAANIRKGQFLRAMAKQYL